MFAWINNTKICRAPPTWQSIIYVLLFPNVWGESLRVVFLFLRTQTPMIMAAKTEAAKQLPYQSRLNDCHTRVSCCFCHQPTFVTCPKLLFLLCTLSDETAIGGSWYTCKLATAARRRQCCR